MKIIKENQFWIDTRLTEEEMVFLNNAISKENKKDYSKNLVGNISKSELIEDKDNWFFESALKKLTEKMFYRDWDVYNKYHVEKEEPPPKFVLHHLWVNYQKQHEFNPIHNHSGHYSFVIFMKIPTHWKEQHALPISVNSRHPMASDFAFVWPEDPKYCRVQNFPLSPEDEGRMLFFPGWLQHEVYPFYECEEERITISGNIRSHDPIGVYEEQENQIKMMESHVKDLKEELKNMKKEA